MPSASASATVRPVAITAGGGGTAREAASGGGAAGITASAAGAGTARETSSGGASATLTVAATGAGTAREQASGGGSAVVTVTARGGAAELPTEAPAVMSGGALWSLRPDDDGMLAVQREERRRVLEMNNTAAIQLIFALVASGEIDL